MKYPCQEGCHSFRTLIEISKRIFFHDSPATCRTKLESETHESLNLRFAICPQQFRRAWPLSARRPGEPGLHLVPNQASPVFPHDELRAAKWLVRPFVTIILSWMIVRVRKSGSPFPQAKVVENSSPRTSKFRRSPCPPLPCESLQSTCRNSLLPSNVRNHDAKARRSASTAFNTASSSRAAARYSVDEICSSVVAARSKA